MERINQSNIFLSSSHNLLDRPEIDSISYDDVLIRSRPIIRFLLLILKTKKIEMIVFLMEDEIAKHIVEWPLFSSFDNQHVFMNHVFLFFKPFLLFFILVPCVAI